MIIFSKAAARELGETWYQQIDGGTGDAWIEFYPGDMPKSPDEPAPAEHLLARLRLQPLTMKVDDGEAVRSGDAGWARIVGTDGRAVADFTISDKKGDGFLRFNTCSFRKAGPVTIFGRLAVFSAQRRDDEED